MRLLQLAIGPDALIDLHPHVTVVTGLDPTGRRLLAEAVGNLAAGRAGGRRGLLEAHGVLFDLAPEALDLLDIDSPELSPVVTADDLSGLRSVAPTAEAPAAGGRTDLDEGRGSTEDAHASTWSPFDAAVEALQRDATNRAAPTAGHQHDDPDRTALRGAAEARAQIEGSTSDASDRQGADVAATAMVAARLEAACQARDPEAARALQEATEALTAIEAEIEAARLAAARPGAPPAGVVPARRLEVLDQEIEALERQLATFAPTDIDEVAQRLAAVNATPVVVWVPMPEAEAMADELAALERQLVATETAESTLGARLAEGRARLDDARQGLLEAEHALRRPQFDRDLVDRLEQVHADLLDALERSGGRVFTARAQRRVASLRLEEDAVLAELGLPSYSDYLMGSSLLHVDPAKEAALDNARAEFAAAEDAFSALSAETETELARAEQMERRRGLVEDARQLLGRSVSSGAVVAELRALRVEAEPSSELLADLRRTLDRAGVALEDGELERDELVVVASAWLAEAEVAAAREEALRADLGRRRDERVEISVASFATADDLETPGAIDIDEVRAARLADARDALTAAEERHRSHLAVEREIATLTEALALAADHQPEVPSPVVADVPVLEHQEAAPDELDHALLSEEVEWYLLARLAAQRSVSLAGSVPLLLDDALADLAPAEVQHVLGRLERMAAAVQVIVVSDDPAAASWAGLAGADRAAVVRPERFAAAESETT